LTERVRSFADYRDCWVDCLSWYNYFFPLSTLTLLFEEKRVSFYFYIFIISVISFYFTHWAVELTLSQLYTFQVTLKLRLGLEREGIILERRMILIVNHNLLHKLFMYWYWLLLLSVLLDILFVCEDNTLFVVVKEVLILIL